LAPGFWPLLSTPLCLSFLSSEAIRVKGWINWKRREEKPGRDNSANQRGLSPQRVPKEPCSQ
jgi:hypothetical protein